MCIHAISPDYFILSNNNNLLINYFSNIVLLGKLSSTWEN